MGNLTPIVVEDAEREQWDEVADLVVVGLGAAGITAAIEARERGADVVLLDRFEGGGATAISGGVFYGGGGTHIQEGAGVEDTVENMYRYLSMEVQDAVSEETLRDFCETSASNVRWLTDRGVPFLPNLCPVKTSYPASEYHLYYSGNETFPPYSDHATPAQRGHRADGGAFPGASITEPLRQTAIDEGVRIQLQSRVVVWWASSMNRFPPRCGECFTGTCTVSNSSSARSRRAWRAGYAGDATESKTGIRHRVGFDASAGRSCARAGSSSTARWSRSTCPNSSQACHSAPRATTGWGFGSAKASAVSSRKWTGPRLGVFSIHPTPSLKACWSTARASGSDQDLKKLAHEQSKPGKLQWFQQATAFMNLYLNCKKAKDVETLAKMLDVPRDTLQETLDEYNEAADGKRSDRFHKAGDSMHPLPDGPYYAIDCSLGSKTHLCAVMTLGGLAVDEKTGEVLSESGGVVPGLYAAGRNAVGICSRQYVSGLRLRLLRPTSSPASNAAKPVDRAARIPYAGHQPEEVSHDHSKAVYSEPRRNRGRSPDQRER